MVNLDEYKDMFLSETSEHLQMLNDNLLKIEKDPSDMEALKNVFRSTHTIKGMLTSLKGSDAASTIDLHMEGIRKE